MMLMIMLLLLLMMMMVCLHDCYLHLTQQASGKLRGGHHTLSGEHVSKTQSI